MILVDEALAKRARAGRPIRTSLVGFGFMGRAIARQIALATPGMELASIVCRDLERARTAARELGLDPSLCTVDPAAALADPSLDAVLEATGSLDYGAEVVLRAIERRKHVILMNAELDGTIGSLLCSYASSQGIVYTACDGDQPAVTMNLFRFVRGMGLRPVLCGNIKGLHDPYRTPATQEGFARRWGQNVHMVTSFADGTKISFEQTIVANGTGMKVLRRGMLGPTVEAGTPIEQAAAQFPVEELMNGSGVVDYVVGAAPAPGVFVLATCDDPFHRHYLELYKLGTGPLYCFYQPYHLCHFEAPNSIARAVLFGDATLAPLGAPCVDVIAAAKTDLPAGATLDGIGGFTCYGLAENHCVARRERLLLMGLAEGCRLLQPLARDQLITMEHVEPPPAGATARLRAEQDRCFS